MEGKLSFILYAKNNVSICLHTKENSEKNAWSIEKHSRMKGSTDKWPHKEPVTNAWHTLGEPAEGREQHMEQVKQGAGHFELQGAAETIRFKQ